MKSTNYGIPCNETRFTPKARRDSITYEFVSDDGVTPNRVTLRVGDVDPISGEVITKFILNQYYKVVDSEVHKTLDSMRRGYTDYEKARRKEASRAWAAEFREDHGYEPSRDNVRYHLEQNEDNRYNVYYDALVNEDGESITDCISDYGRCDADPFGADLPDDLYALKEVAESLTGRRKAVFEAMIVKASGAGAKISNVKLAKAWGVGETQIRKDQKMIRKMIKKRLGNNAADKQMIAYRFIF